MKKQFRLLLGDTIEHEVVRTEREEWYPCETEVRAAITTTHLAENRSAHLIVSALRESLGAKPSHKADRSFPTVDVSSMTTT